MGECGLSVESNRKPNVWFHLVLAGSDRGFAFGYYTTTFWYNNGDDLLASAGGVWKVRENRGLVLVG